MIYGVLSDIHGNWEAFEAALKRLKSEGAQKYIFCGDLIGYGPDPEKCVQKYAKMQEAGLALGVQGNHDAVFSHPELREYFNPEALASLDWSAERLSKKSVRLVSFLPEIIYAEHFCAVHGTPMDPIREYFVNCRQYRQAWDWWRGEILFVGHSHVAFCMEGDAQSCQVSFAGKEGEIYLHPQLRCVINPGSVGKPRDNDPRASFGIWNEEERTFRFVRQEYDYAKTQDKMRAAGISPLLVESLALGM